MPCSRRSPPGSAIPRAPTMPDGAPAPASRRRARRSPPHWTPIRSRSCSRAVPPRRTIAALAGVIDGADARRHLAVAATEHASVLAPARALAGRGHRVTVLATDADGRCDPCAIAAAAARPAVDCPGECRDRRRASARRARRDGARPRRARPRRRGPGRRRARPRRRRARARSDDALEPQGRRAAGRGRALRAPRPNPERAPSWRPPGAGDASRHRERPGDRRLRDRAGDRGDGAPTRAGTPRRARGAPPRRHRHRLAGDAARAGGRSTSASRTS